ncbi:hypothetical protein Chls_037 [Chlamydia suis]|uniref:Uncharacterized protein n=1 Tax=Chlamydia suis TaxID=83559 RepID=A0ABX6IQ42_9CHLA|nr:hypothetical protein Chls_037 [Chlamydia suis]
MRDLLTEKARNQNFLPSGSRLFKTSTFKLIYLCIRGTLPYSAFHSKACRFPGECKALIESRGGGSVKLRLT